MHNEPESTHAMLFATAMNLDGQPIGTVTLTRRADGTLLLDGQPAQKTQVIGSMVGLIVGRRYVCLRAEDYLAAGRLPLDEQTAEPQLDEQAS